MVFRMWIIGVTHTLVYLLISSQDCGCLKAQMGVLTLACEVLLGVSTLGVSSQPDLRISIRYTMLNFQFKLQFTAPSYSLNFFCKMVVFLGIEFYWICVTQAKNLIQYKILVYKQSLHGWKTMWRNWDFQWFNSGHLDMTGIYFLLLPYSPWVPSKSVYNHLFRYGLAYLGRHC